MIWDDQADEVGYEVEGRVGYYYYTCLNGIANFEDLGTFEFSERLRANVTEFRLPRPEDERANFSSGYEFKVRAIGNGGEAINSDGRYIIADPAPCVPASRGGS